MTIARLDRRSNERSAERFHFVESTVHCGELGGKGRRGLVTSGKVGPVRVVVGDPFGDGASGMTEAQEQLLDQQIVRIFELNASPMPFCFDLPGAL